MRISDWSSDVCSSDLSPATMNGRMPAGPVRSRALTLRASASAPESALFARTTSAKPWRRTVEPSDNTAAPGQADRGWTRAILRRCWDSSLERTDGRLHGQPLGAVGAHHCADVPRGGDPTQRPQDDILALRSEGHTSELQSLMRISYAVF